MVLSLRTPIFSPNSIGIGAGKNCDGQVLVYHEVIGMNSGESPRFVKQYGQVGKDIITAVTNYCAEVRNKEFPDLEHSYLMNKKESQVLRKNLINHVQ